MALKNILLVGLGGTGGYITAYVKKILSESENDIVSRNIKFLVIDSEDYKAQDAYVRDYIKLEEGEYFNIGGKNPRNYVDTAIRKRNVGDPDLYNQLNTYFDLDSLNFLNTLPNHIITTGAGRKRSVGRLLLYMARESIKNLIDDKIKLLRPSDNNSGIEVFLIAGCCGGTGSSLFYDVLRYIGASEHKVHPVIVGPSLHVAKNEQMHQALSEQMQMNAFAFFEELAVYLKFPTKNFSFMVQGSSGLQIPHVFFFDDYITNSATNSQPARSTLRTSESQTDTYNLYSHIGNCIYILTCPREDTQNGTSDSSAYIFSNLINMEELVSDEHNYGTPLPESYAGTHQERGPFISLNFFRNKAYAYREYRQLCLLLGEHLKGSLSFLSDEDLFKQIITEHGRTYESSLLDTFRALTDSGPADWMIDKLQEKDFLKDYKEANALPINLKLVEKYLNLLKGFINHKDPDNDSSSKTQPFRFLGINWSELRSSDRPRISTVPYVPSPNVDELERKIDSLLIILNNSINKIEGRLKDLRKEFETVEPDFSQKDANRTLRHFLKNGFFETAITNEMAVLTQFQQLISQLPQEHNRDNIAENISNLEQNIQKVIWLVNDATERQNYATIPPKVARNETVVSGSETQIYVKVGLHQRNYAIWTHGTHEYIHNYYYRHQKNYVFFPHFDRRFEPDVSAIPSGNIDILAYLDTRRIIWLNDKALIEGSQVNRSDYHLLMAFGLLIDKLPESFAEKSSAPLRLIFRKRDKESGFYWSVKLPKEAKLYKSLARQVDETEQLSVFIYKDQVTNQDLFNS